MARDWRNLSASHRRGVGFRRRQPLFPIGTADPATDAAERWLRQYEREAAGDDSLDTIPAATGSFGANENVFEFAGNVWEYLLRSSDIAQPARERHQSRPAERWLRGQ
jgi:formylglycine-generating enzyme required for sulfatase activity